MSLSMSGFTKWLENRLMPPLMRLAEKKSVVAAQKGIIYCIPVLIVFIIFFLLLFPITNFNSRFLESFRAALFMTSLFASFLVAYKLGEYWKTGRVISGIMGFLLFTATLPVYAKFHSIYGFITHISTMCLISAVVIAMITSYVFRYINIRKGVKRSYSIIIMGVLIIFSGFLIQHFEINLYSFLDYVFKPILIAGDSLPGMLAVIGIICILWMGGVNGGIAIAPIVAPLYLGMLAANTSAFQAGQSHVPYIVTPPFFNFIFQGGGGTTLPLVVMMLFSKVKKLRKLGKVAILPSIFNINEVVIYGAPVVMNPLLWIPFLFAPLVIGTITYLAMYFHLVSKVIYFIPGFVPGVVVAYLSTGGDYRALILAVINLVIAAVIYYPFFIAYEKIKAKEADETMEGCIEQ
ncbi:MAG: PTS transporter subunit EIIC [Chloroflexi bacterium]|nr:PTS transporter subunit EIIC [Chloroflexota bacterium]